MQMLDAHLLDDRPRPQLSGWRRFAVEFLYFGVKEARACLFVGAVEYATTDTTSATQIVVEQTNVSVQAGNAAIDSNSPIAQVTIYS